MLPNKIIQSISVAAAKRCCIAALEPQTRIPLFKEVTPIPRKSIPGFTKHI